MIAINREAPDEDMRPKRRIIDLCSGTTDDSLETLESVLRDMHSEVIRGDPVRIYELRDMNKTKETFHQEEKPDPNPPILLGFWLQSREIEGIIGHSFWMPMYLKADFPDKKVVSSYVSLTPDDGGTGTAGYENAIALIYRYLHHQPRQVVNFSYRGLERVLSGNAPLIKIENAPIIEVINECETDVMSRLFGDFTRYDHRYDFSFVVLDLETDQYEDFLLGVTWDFYHGYRVWDRPEKDKLTDELGKFDKIVTYNGNTFDFRVLDFKDSEHPLYLLNGKKNRSIDLYDIIRSSYEPQEGRNYPQKGELTLGNVSSSTLGYHKSDVVHARKLVTPSAERQLLQHCIVDVGLTLELFFFMLKEGYVLHATRRAMNKGQAVEEINVRTKLGVVCV